MTSTLAGSLAGGVLVVAGIMGLALLLGQRTDEGGPLIDEPEFGVFRGIGVAISAACVVAGFLVFGASTT